MRTSTRRYYEDLLARERTLALTFDEARADLERSFIGGALGSLN